ncbi:hypothetical protein GCM10022246_32840 [Pedobacter ginsengiterrae]|uniref:Lipocalin-like domain-containing protein n=1 Tax=Pedobacter ginsengiterrae TaxID=871696 RepID=A0ABP7Q8W5_9SPHI|nr:hypothetical protein [Pedobacter aquatilis]
MKNILKLTLVLSILFIFSACKKKSLEKGINGTWELRHVAGGMIAGADPNYKKGNGDIYVFNNQNFERYSQGKLIQSGTFVMSTERKDINNNQANSAITFSTSAEKYYTNLSGNKLTIFIGVIAADGVEVTYERQ